MSTNASRTIASALNERFASLDPGGKDRSVFTFVDDHGVFCCITEELLDTWWQGLTAQDKAELYDQANENFLPVPASVENGTVRALMLRGGVAEFLAQVDGTIASFGAVASPRITEVSCG